MSRGTIVCFLLEKRANLHSGNIPLVTPLLFPQDITLEKGLATFSSKYSSLHIFFFFFWKMFIPGQHVVQDRSRHIVVFVGSRRLLSTSHVRVIVEMLT